MHIDRVNFLDLHFDLLSFPEIKHRLQAVKVSSRYEYIVTPNVDHVVRVHREPELRELYERADLCVCDSRVLKFLARLKGVRLPLVAGSDLSATLFTDIIKPRDRIAVVGADRACLEQLRAKFPETQFLHFEPPMNLRADARARSEAAAFIASSQARFAFIAVGSPQQEMIAREVREFPTATGMGLCIGAGLDFITGKQKRAPKVIQNLGLEWAHRLLSNPRRLWRRYMIDGLRIFPLWLRWRRGKAHAGSIVPLSLLGALFGAIALYVGMSFEAGRPSGTSLDLWLPPVQSQSAAAVQSLPAPGLLKPLSPDQAAKENTERPFVTRPDTPARKFILHTDADNQARALTCLSQAVYYEAAGEGVDGGRAVAQVVLNRVRHPGFPSTICGVVYEGADRPTGCQFSFTCDGSMQRVPVSSLWARSKKIAGEALKGEVFGPVGHATHYHADYVLPYWADSLDKSVQIGRHIFYRLRNVFGEARAFSQHYAGTEPPFREPGTAIIIPETPEGQQLADKLMGDQSKAGEDRNATPAAPKPATPLIIDAQPSTLLVGEDSERQRPRRKGKSTDCGGSRDQRQLSPLKPTDMRSGSIESSC
ncbi:MAG TPA: WecB/TagA/CpsF family glycosyltransferase [Sphingomicrobium sp.]|nr:WecB/TagA/CpsF family glycosyltransferase [Sphingomicrobium sp.]